MTANSEQLNLELVIVQIRFPTPPKRSTICAAGTVVTFDGVSKPALQWAIERNIKWQTVKMRRMRGDSWTQALAKSRPRCPNSAWNAA